MCGSSSVPQIEQISKQFRAAAGSWAINSGRILSRSVADHEIEQDHACFPVIQRIGEHLIAMTRIDHGMRAPNRVLVFAQIEQNVRVVTQA